MLGSQAKERRKMKEKEKKDLIGLDGPETLQWKYKGLYEVLPRVETRIVNTPVGPDLPEGAEAADMVFALDCVKEYLSGLATERVISVNCRDSKALNYCICAVGTHNQCEAQAVCENVLKAAIASNANNVYLVHNHPYGKAEPSEGDLACMYMLRMMLEMMDMWLHDVFIVGEDGEIVSVRQTRPEFFKEIEDPCKYIPYILEREGILPRKEDEPPQEEEK